MTTVLRAYGHQPVWEKNGKNQLSAESHRLYASIDLHLHDLRREAASRLVEAGATLVEAQHLLGHSSVSQTATYLASSLKALETAIDRKEAPRATAGRCAGDGATLGGVANAPVEHSDHHLGPERIQ